MPSLAQPSPAQFPSFFLAEVSGDSKVDVFWNIRHFGFLQITVIDSPRL